MFPIAHSFFVNSKYFSTSSLILRWSPEYGDYNLFIRINQYLIGWKDYFAICFDDFIDGRGDEHRIPPNYNSIILSTDVLIYVPRYNFFDHYNPGFMYNQHFTKYYIARVVNKLSRLSNFLPGDNKIDYTLVERVRNYKKKSKRSVSLDDRYKWRSHKKYILNL